MDKKNLFENPEPRAYPDLKPEPLEEFEQEILERILVGDLEPELLDEDEPVSGPE